MGVLGNLKCARFKCDPLCQDEMYRETKVSTLRLIRKEMCLFELNPDMEQPMLAMLKKALLTVVPTSVEPERCFSAAGQICTKLRTSLKDDFLTYCIQIKAFLQEYYS